MEDNVTYLIARMQHPEQGVSKIIKNIDINTSSSALPLFKNSFLGNVTHITFLKKFLLKIQKNSHYIKY